MDMTQRGRLSSEDEEDLLLARDDASMATAHYRRLAVEMVERSSYREVERLTGVSTNTLQRWKKEIR